MPAATAFRSLAARVVALVEVAEVDVAADRADPRERSVTSPAVLFVCAFSTTQVRQFGILREQRGVAGEVALEAAEERVEEQVRRERRRAGSRDDRQDRRRSML